MSTTNQLTITLDQILEGATGVPGVVAAVANADGVLYQGAAGLRDVASGEAMETDTIFDIASMTKPVTTVAVLQLVEQGRVALDAPVSEYLPQIAGLQVLDHFDADDKMVLTPPPAQPTVRQLLTHTSGYVYEIWNENALKSVTTGQVASFFASADGLLAPLGFAPGSRWEYGISIDIAGLIVEAVADKPLDVYFADHIFTPLGMPDTFYVVPEDKLARRATIHVRTDGGYEPAPSLQSRVTGGGGLSTTISDYVCFIRALLNGGEVDGARILEPATVDMMFENQIGEVSVLPGSSAMPDFSNDFDMGFGVPAKWGLGFLLNSEPDPAGRAAGSGSWAGLFNSYFWIDRESDVCALLATQILPFYDAAAVALLKQFEEGVYAR
jgi:CubicO group peptidase (beta-lactamase class C family)